MQVIQAVGVIALVALAVFAAFKGAVAAETCVAAHPYQGRARCAVEAAASFTIAAAAFAAALVTACA